MTIIRSPLRSPIRSPIYSPTVGKWGASVEYATLTSVSEVTHNGRTFDVVRASDSANVDMYTAPDGSPVIISYGEDVTITPQTASSVVSGSYSDTGTYTDRTVNGCMVNPGNISHATSGLRSNNYYGGSQGWDSLPSVTYAGGSNVTSFTGSEGTFVQAISDLTPPSSKRSCIENYAMVTVVETAPVVGALRPAQSASVKTWPGTVATVRAYVDSISTRTSPAGWTADEDVIIAALQAPEQVHWTFLNEGRDLFPSDRGSTWVAGYGRDYALRMAEALSALQYSDIDIAKRYTIAELLVQIGIDLHDRTYTQGGEFPGNGSLNNGRWQVAAFAATVLNDSAMKANVNATGTVSGVDNIDRWHEVGQAIVVAPSDVANETHSLLISAYKAVKTAGSGYSVDDIVSIVGGVTISGDPTTLRITSVSSGAVTGFSIETDERYLIPPAGNNVLTVTGGGGTGFVPTSRFDACYFDAQIGAVEWGVNPNETRNPDPNNAHLYATYRQINYNSTVSMAIAVRGLPGMLTTMNAENYFELADRAYWADTIASEVPATYALNDWSSERGFSDVTPPALLSASIGSIPLLTLKFERGLKEKTGYIPVLGDFVVKVDGTPVSKTILMVWGPVVAIGLAAPVTGTDVVTVSYTKGTSPAVIQDYSGNEVASFTDQAVTNLSPLTGVRTMVFFGQSEPVYVTESTSFYKQITYPTLDAENMVLYQRNGSGGSVGSIIKTDLNSGNYTTVNPCVVALANWMDYVAPGIKFVIGELTEEGTNRKEFMDDADSNRLWADSAEIVTEILNDYGQIDRAAEFWYASDIASMPSFLANFAPYYYGQNVDGSAFTLGNTISTATVDTSAICDHCIYDFESGGSSILGRGLLKRTTPYDIIRKTVWSADTASRWSGMDAFVADSRFVALGGKYGPPAGTWYSDGHPVETDPDGVVEAAYDFYGPTLLRLAGETADEASFDTIVVAGDKTYADISFTPANGGILSTKNIIKGTTPPASPSDYWQEVAGFEIQRNSGGGRYYIVRAGAVDGNSTAIDSKYHGTVELLDDTTVRITPVVPFATGDIITYLTGRGFMRQDYTDRVEPSGEKHDLDRAIEHVAAYHDSGAMYPFKGFGIKNYGGPFTIPGLTEPTTWFTMGSAGPVFVDPVTVPPNTTRIHYNMWIKIPGATASASGGKFVFAQESTGWDYLLTTNAGATNIYVSKVEDGTGANVSPSGTSIALVRDIWNYIEIYADQVAKEVVITLNGGTPTSYPFTGSGNGVFQTGREISMLGSSLGATPLHQGIQIGLIECYFTTGGTTSLRKSISGNAATVNADGWKYPGTSDAT